MKNSIIRIVLITILVVIAAPVISLAYSPTVSTQQSRQAAENWTYYLVAEKGGWGDATQPIVESAQIISDGSDTLGYYFDISPNGYVVCPTSNLLPPVKSYSTSHGLKLDDEQGFASILREILKQQSGIIADFQGDLSRYANAGIDTTELKNYRKLWEIYSLEKQEFFEEIGKSGFNPTDDIGPLLETTWEQGDPYNQMCPMGNGGRCVVGCVATAAAQIMRYHQWPPNGEGSHSYYWEGDPPVPGQTLTADFSDAYDWQNMLLAYTGFEPQNQIDAVAELGYEIGVAFEMDYGYSGSSAYTGDALTVYPTWFRYSDEIDREDRPDYSSAQLWFEMIQDDLNDYHPIQYRVVNHSIVCDGWQIFSTLNQIHLNYGWGGSYDNWYTVDELYLGNPDEEYLIRRIFPDIFQPPPPLPITDLTITISGNNAILDWTPVPGADTYNIYRGNTPYFELSGNLIASVNEPGWTDFDALNEEAYFYIVTSEGNFQIIEQDFPLGTTGEYITMVWIPPGSFMQGAYTGELGASSSEYPQHLVTLDYGFWLGKYEVTQGQWEAIMGAWSFYFNGHPNRPAEMVSWNDIVNDFLTELNSQTAGEPWRLPSESEWEYACRAGTETRYYWGDDLNYIEIDDYAWYYYNSGSQTHDVGLKLPNAWGLYDMSGNVWEWVEDYWHTNYNGAPTNGSAWLSPTSSYRVLRGGGWGYYPYRCRSAYRRSRYPFYRSYDVGFRLLRSP